MAKLASIASVVSFPELFYPADMARSLTLDSRPVVSAAAIRIVILWSLPYLAGRLERCAAAH